MPKMRNIIIRKYPIQGTPEIEYLALDPSRVTHVEPSTDSEEPHSCVVSVRSNTFPYSFHALGITAEELRLQIDRWLLGFD